MRDVLELGRRDKTSQEQLRLAGFLESFLDEMAMHCLLYTSDAADERSSVDLGGRRIIKKKKRK